ncbi:MAG: DUF1543 domain-containing protein, partial [Sphingobacteriales bacterium]
FWPEAKGKIHIDAWRTVTCVDGFKVEVVAAEDKQVQPAGLFFLNLGGYKPGEFDELHYMMLVAEGSKAAAIKRGKETAFFKHATFEGATSHIDDKYGVDIDDVYEIEEILSGKFKTNYSIKLTKAGLCIEDEMHLGYLPIKNIP